MCERRRKKKTQKGRREEVGGAGAEAAVRAERCGSEVGKASSAGHKEAVQVAVQDVQLTYTAKRATSHALRYTKQKAAKRTKTYSSSDLAAILGIRAADLEDQEGPNREPAEPPSRYVALEEEVDDDEEGAAVPPADARAPGTDPEGSCGPPGAGRAPWWTQTFVRRGRLGSMKEDTSPAENGAIRVHGFREADQEGLYNATHDKAVQGRKGLGGAQALRKVAGARWQGTRTVLDSDDDDAEDASEGEPCLQNEIDNEEEPDRIVIVGPKRTAGQVPNGDAQSEEPLLNFDPRQDASAHTNVPKGMGVGKKKAKPLVAKKAKTKGEGKKRERENRIDGEKSREANPCSTADGKLKRKKQRGVCVPDVDGDRTPAVQGPAGSPSLGGDGGARTDKWVKAAKRVLQGAGKGLKMRHLCKKAICSRGKQVSEEVMALVEGRIAKSSSFVVSSKGVVTLPS
eukprot:jgi/Botrbrau1/1996/Bobra.0052s0038.1